MPISGHAIRDTVLSTDGIYFETGPEMLNMDQIPKLYIETIRFGKRN